ALGLVEFVTGCEYVGPQRARNHLVEQVVARAQPLALLDVALRLVEAALPKHRLAPLERQDRERRLVAHLLAALVGTTQFLLSTCPGAGPEAHVPGAIRRHDVLGLVAEVANPVPVRRDRLESSVELAKARAEMPQNVECELLH